MPDTPTEALARRLRVLADSMAIVGSDWSEHNANTAAGLIRKALASADALPPSPVVQRAKAVLHNAAELIRSAPAFRLLGTPCGDELRTLAGQLRASPADASGGQPRATTDEPVGTFSPQQADLNILTALKPLWLEEL